MGFQKPFHRIYRPEVSNAIPGQGTNGYIVDKEYSKNPEHFIRSFMLLQEDILKLFEFIEPSDKNLKTHSFRIHELLMRMCIEVEANFKAILNENIFNPINKKRRLIPYDEWGMNQFKVVNKSHHLDAYTVEFPYWIGENRIRKPFESWKTNGSLTWYQAYNRTKHDRHLNFEEANFKNLLDAFSGLFVLLSSQFETNDFGTGMATLGLGFNTYFEGKFGIGQYLIINFPDDWKEEEKYDFNWIDLNEQKDRFEKFNYDHL